MSVSFEDDNWQQVLAQLSPQPSSVTPNTTPRRWEEACRYRARRFETTLQDLRLSPALTVLRIWHMYGVWVSSCVYFTLASNLLLAWYIDWYRESIECDTRPHCKSIFLRFPIGPFFAIFLRSWMLFCLAGELLRFCYLLAKDAWHEDQFQMYRRVVCGDFMHVLERDRQGGDRTGEDDGQWSEKTLEAPLALFLDRVLQISIYGLLDVVPFVCAVVQYCRLQSLEAASLGLSAAVSSGACLHVFIFFAAWSFTDLRMKVSAFRAAWRGEGKLRPHEIPGQSLQNFQWADGFSDRHFANLEAARCTSFVGNVDDWLNGVPHRCVSDVSGPLPLASGSRNLSFSAPPSQALAETPQLSLPSTASGSRPSSFQQCPRGSWQEGNEAEMRSRMRVHLEGLLSRALPSAPEDVLERLVWELGNLAVADGSSVGSMSFYRDWLRRTDRLVWWLSRDEHGASQVLNGCWTVREALAAAGGEISTSDRWRSNSHGSRRALLVEGMVGESSAQTVADKLNICVPLCGWLRSGTAFGLLLVVCWITLVLAAARLHHWSLIGLGVLLGLLAVCYRVCRGASLPPPPEQALFGRGGSWELWALQAWCEHHCSFRYEEQFARRKLFGFTVLLQGVFFFILSQWAGATVCAVTLALIIGRQLLAECERPWGWLLGLTESLVGVLLAAGLNYTFFGLRWGLTTLLLALLTQCGLARYNPRGFRVARFVVLLLCVVLVVFGGVAAAAVAESGNHSEHSKFCDVEKPGCKYYEVPLLFPNSTQGRGACGRFSYGREGGKSLTLSDFALLSSLAYEPKDGLEFGLERWFPGWVLVASRRASFNASINSNDWTTFFEFSDPDNSTTVFAIRGTSSMLDVLDDINIWGSAVIMQAFSTIGPSLSIAVAQAVALLSTVIYGRAMEKDYFSSLLAHVQRRVEVDPQRRFYITGHSLGGGLAKLVAAKVGMQAVTFMAPGLVTTSYVVYGEHIERSLRHTSLTVMPENDIVSRLDKQSGRMIQTDCDGNAIHCHLFCPTLCNIFEMCGSGRSDPSQALYLPCGMCPSMPCPGQ